MCGGRHHVSECGRAALSGLGRAESHGRRAAATYAPPPSLPLADSAHSMERLLAAFALALRQTCKAYSCLTGIVTPHTSIFISEAGEQGDIE
jgi:hypothetical protein